MSDYPPNGTPGEPYVPATTVVTLQPEPLPSTGSDITGVVGFGGTLVCLGLAIAVVAKRFRT